MPDQLPPPARIAREYDELMRRNSGDYLRTRWLESEPQRRHFRQTQSALLRALAALPRLGSVLEIGCGPAVWTTLYLAAARDVTLVDVSEEMLRGARDTVDRFENGRYAGRAHYVNGDFMESAVAAESYDTVIAVRVFEYVAEKAAFVAKCAAALRPGGTLLLVTKNRNWRDVRDLPRTYHGVPATQIPVTVAMQTDLADWRDVERMFTGSGLGDVAVSPVVFGSYHPAFRSRPALAAMDALQRRRVARPMGSALEPLIESYLVTGRKPRSAESHAREQRE